MRRHYWYHEECLSQVETAVRTSKSPHHELCARCGYEGLCMEAELVTNPDVRKIEVGQELKKAADALEGAAMAVMEKATNDAKEALGVESTEETEAVEEVIDEALDAVIEEAAEIEKEPEETVPEPEPKMISLRSDAELEAFNKAKKAKITELEAQIEALRPKK